MLLSWSSILRGARNLAFVVATCSAVSGLTTQRADAQVGGPLQQGRQLLKTGNYAEAIEAFRRAPKSWRTEGNIGYCQDQLGKLGSAWHSYRGALELAAREQDQRSIAKEVAKIEDLKKQAYARAPKISIMAKYEPQGLRLELDGVVRASAEWTHIPVDLGQHNLEAVAPGKVGWSTTVIIERQGETEVVVLPELVDLDAGNGPRATAEATTASASRSATQVPSGLPSASAAIVAPPSQAPGTTQRVVGWIAVGAGVLGVGAAFVTGGLALTKWNEALGYCNQRDECDPRGVALGREADGTADISTALFVAGASTLAAGITVLLLTPSGAPTALRVAPWVAGSSGGLWLQGRF